MLAIAAVVTLALAPVSGIAAAQATPGGVDGGTATSVFEDGSAPGTVLGDVGLQIVTFLDDDEEDDGADSDDDGEGDDSDEEDGGESNDDDEEDGAADGDDDDGDDSDDDGSGDRDGLEDDVDEEDEREDGDSDQASDDDGNGDDQQEQDDADGDGGQGHDDEGSDEAAGSGDTEDGSRADHVPEAVGQAVGHVVAVGETLAPEGDDGPRDPPGQVDRPDSPATRERNEPRATPATDSSNGEAPSDSGSSSSAGSTGGDGEDESARAAAPSSPAAAPEVTVVQASTPTPAPGKLRVADVSTNRSAVTAGEPVRITATVVNEGSATATRRLRLHLFGEVVDARSVRVPPDSSRRATFVRQIVAPGTYRATVGNASTEVTVEAGASPSGSAATGVGFPDSQATPGFTALAAFLALLAAVSVARFRAGD